MKKKINWWVIIAIIVIGIPIGFAGTGVIHRLLSQEAPALTPTPPDSDIKVHHTTECIDTSKNSVDSTKITEIRNANKLDSQKTKQDSVLPTIIMNVRPESVKFEAQSSTKKITVKSNTNWSVASTGGDNWLTIGSTEGNGDKDILLQTTENTSERNRSATLVLSWKDKQGTLCSRKISVTQAGIPPRPKPYLKINTTNLSFSAKGGSKTLTISSNTNWEVTMINGDDWLTINNTEGKGEKNITLNVNGNSNPDIRTTYLKILWKDDKGTTQSKIVNVSQLGIIPPSLRLTVSPENISVGANGGSKTISIKSNTNWEIITKEDNEWLNASNTAGSGNKNVIVNISKNSTTSNRIATLKINWKDGEGVTQSKNVKVEQKKGDSPLPVPTSLSNEEAQRILSSGKRSSKIPDGCKIIVNGSPKDYQSFRTGVGFNTYSDIIVTNISFDKNGEISSITVKAKVYNDNE